MESPHARSRRDARTVEHEQQQQAAESKLMCTAHGCPNRWSVDAGKGRLCSAHAWIPTKDWPAATQQQLDAQADRAAFPPAPPPSPPRRDMGQLRAELAKLAGARSIEGRNVEWAKDILRHPDGCTDAQLQIARAAVRESIPGGGL